MSTYTKESQNIYFLNDKNIVQDVSDTDISNAIPSHSIFKEKYEELTSYDDRLCSYAKSLDEKTNKLSDDLSNDIDSISIKLSSEINALSDALSGEVDSLSDKLSTDLSSEISDRIEAVQKLSDDLSSGINKLSGDLSSEIKNLSTSLSNTADAKFVLKTGDSIEKLSVGELKTTDAAMFEKNVEVKGNVVIGNAKAPYESMFVWNGTTDEYSGKVIDAGIGNTFSINPNHELCGMFIGDKSLCAYISEDVALTATDIRKEIDAVSTLLTTGYALSSDVSTAIDRIDNTGYLVSNDFKFEYKDKALWLSAGSKTISVDATDFIVDGLLASAEVSSNIDGEGDTPYLVLTFRTYKDGEVVLDTQKVSLAKVADVYESTDDGIEINDYKVHLNYDVVAKAADTKQLRTDTDAISAKADASIVDIEALKKNTEKLQSYANELSTGPYGTIPTIITDINNLSSRHIDDVESLRTSINNSATFAGTIDITKDMTESSEYDTIAKLLKKSNSTAFRDVKNGDIYQVKMDTGFNDNTAFGLAGRYFETKDNPPIRLAHKDLIVIFKEFSDKNEITEANIHNYVRILPSVRLYEYYGLSVTVSSDYVWLSGGNNLDNKHAISGGNYFLGRNDAEQISAGSISVDWKNVKHPTGYSLYDLSVDLSNKIYIDDKVNNDINGTSDLSIVKISKEEYDSKVSLEINALCANTLYIVDSDYIDAYGQTMQNLTMANDNNASEATNKHYVDSLCASLSDTVALSVENLQAQIISNDGDIKYLSSQHGWLSTALSTGLSNEIVARDNAVNQLQASLIAETARAKVAEEDNANAISTISTDYLKAADKTELTNAINYKANNSDVESIKSAIRSALTSLTFDSQLSDVITALSTIAEALKQ